MGNKHFSCSAEVNSACANGFAVQMDLRSKTILRRTRAGRRWAAVVQVT